MTALPRPDGWRDALRGPTTPIPVEQADGGVRFPVRPSVAVVVGTGVAGALLLALGLAALVLRPADGGSRAGTAVLGVVLSAFALVLLSVPVGWVRGAKDRRLGVVLTPEAVVVHQGRRVVTVPWDAVTDVRAETLHLRVPPHLLRTRGQAFVVVHADLDRVDGIPERVKALTARTGQHVAASIGMTNLRGEHAQLWHALRFWWQHPQERVELGDGTGLARVQARDLLG